LQIEICIYYKATTRVAKEKVERVVSACGSQRKGKKKAALICYDDCGRNNDSLLFNYVVNSGTWL